jgi:hypothetical protein
VLDATERAALVVLARRLGWVGALRVGLAVERARRRGEPFADLPPATDAKESGSRAQAGPAILLFRALRDRVGAEAARSITGEAVSAGAITFLRASLGPLRRAELAALDDAGRRAFAADRADRFPNATLTWDEVSAERVAFTVHLPAGGARGPRRAPGARAAVLRRGRRVLRRGRAGRGARPPRDPRRRRGRVPVLAPVRAGGPVRWLHWGLIGALALEAGYCWFQVLVVLAPAGPPLPLFFAAREVPFELVVERRLYALEGWLAMVGLALYLAVTEVLPRRLRRDA